MFGAAWLLNRIADPSAPTGFQCVLGGSDLIETIWVVLPTSATRPTLFLCQQDFETSLSKNTCLWLDFFLRYGRCFALMHGHRSFDGTLNPGGEVLETKSLSQPNRYWHAAAFSLALIGVKPILS